MSAERECEFCHFPASKFVKVHLSTGTFTYGYCGLHGPIGAPFASWVEPEDAERLLVGGKRPGRGYKRVRRGVSEVHDG